VQLFGYTAVWIALAVFAVDGFRARIPAVSLQYD